MYLQAQTIVVFMGDLIMNKENCESLRKGGLPNPQQVGLLMGVVALVAPYGFIYYPSVRFPEVHIFAVIWLLLIGVTGWYFLVNILDHLLTMNFQIIMIYFFLIGVRILFAYQIMRYFQRKTTRKRLITLGVIAELPMALFLLMDILHFVILTILGKIGGFDFLTPIPIPCMLILSFLFLRFVPALGESDGDLKRKTEEWWLETNPDPAKVQE